MDNFDFFAVCSIMYIQQVIPRMCGSVWFHYTAFGVLLWEQRVFFNDKVFDFVIITIVTVF